MDQFKHDAQMFMDLMNSVLHAARAIPCGTDPRNDTGPIIDLRLAISSLDYFLVKEAVAGYLRQVAGEVAKPDKEIAS